MNIGANVHGKRTVSTKQPQVTVTRLLHSATVSQCDHFLKILFGVWGGGVGGGGGVVGVGGGGGVVGVGVGGLIYLVQTWCGEKLI